MATVILGQSIPKVVVQGSRKLLTSQGNSNLSLLLSRTIVGKSNRDPNYQRIPPFPYKEKKYSLFQSLIDRTTYRFDENSKIIVVDGAVAAGKTAFAKQLAEELDMLYMPEGNMDMFYINPYGYDMRQLDPQLPKSLRSFDTKKFSKDPHHLQTAFLQTKLLVIKYAQYIDALTHVLNTGQGVVMDKSFYSDFVYADAMAKEGFITKLAKSVYHDLRRHAIIDLMKPHLAIYLDVPVPKIQEKVKQRGRPEEQNSKAFSPSFLTALEENYKRAYLKEIGNGTCINNGCGHECPGCGNCLPDAHAELLIYDWSDGGDVEVVVEDIERIDFDRFTKYDKKLEDWRLFNEQMWSDKRMMYTDHKAELMENFNVPRYDCPELIADGNDLKTWLKVWFNAPGMRYAYGYNSDQGDKSVFFKIKRKVKYSFY